MIETWLTWTTNRTTFVYLLFPVKLKSHIKAMFYYGYVPRLKNITFWLFRIVRTSFCLVWYFSPLYPTALLFNRPVSYFNVFARPWLALDTNLLCSTKGQNRTLNLLTPTITTGWCATKMRHDDLNELRWTRTIDCIKHLIYSQGRYQLRYTSPCNVSLFILH